MLSDEVLSIVFDIGSLSVRAGFSGDDAPRHFSTSKVGEYTGGMAEERNGSGAKQQNLEFGDEYLYKHRENFEIKDSILNGVMQPNHYARLVENCYKRLSVDPKENSVLIANNFINKQEREKATDIFFDGLGVPALFTIRNSVLSAFSSGRSSALVLDIGAYQSTAIAVHEGYALVKSASGHPVGGETLSQLFLRELNLQNTPLRYQISTDSEGKKHFHELQNTTASFHNFHLMELLRDLKEQVIHVPDPNLGVLPPQNQYEFPDGQKIDISPKIIYDISEVLFGSNLESLSGITNAQSYKGLQHMIVEVLNQTSTDLKQMLCSTILTTGGSSAISGLMPRLNNQLQTLAPPQCKVKLVNYPSPQNRQHSVFIGGSILASLSSFQSMWVTKQEYQEIGNSIIERKCPM